MPFVVIGIVVAVFVAWKLFWFLLPLAIAIGAIRGLIAIGESK